MPNHYWFTDAKTFLDIWNCHQNIMNVLILTPRVDLVLRTWGHLVSGPTLTTSPNCPNFTSSNPSNLWSCPNVLMEANKWSCCCLRHSQRPAAASVCGWEERGRGEARSAVPRRRRSGLPTLCHGSHPQTPGPGASEQKSSAPVHLTSCPWGHPAHGAQHRTSGELMTQVGFYSVLVVYSHCTDFYTHLGLNCAFHI